MTDAHEVKYREMQKYVPFIQRVMEKLKANNEHQTNNPRKAQLQKMEMLHELLTNKHKKIKMETLLKCEGVLIKLQSKIEKQPAFLQNEDSILSDVRLKQQPSSSKPSVSTSTIASTSKNNNVLQVEDISGPASPPPEVIHEDQPVVIPTERRGSPILAKEIKKSILDKQQKTKETPDKAQVLKHSNNEDFENLRKKVFPLANIASTSSNSNETGKHFISQDKSAHHSQRPCYDSRPKEHHHHSKHLIPIRKKSPSTKEKLEYDKSLSSPTQKLQAVEVVITESLPPFVNNQNCPTSSRYMPTSSVCHHNLKALPQANQKSKDDNNDAYSPEDLWEQYNKSHNKRPSTSTPSKAPVFSRLGDKVSEDPRNSCSSSKIPGRYTPIPDVLKSPPLSVNDINNLLLESGADKISNDISEIGTRRPPKNEDTQKGSPINSLDFLRKKLVQSAKINSPLSESLKTQSEKEVCNISSLPNERVALKYNPHPRQERLQSVSSTDGSECSTQSKINDPRIKFKLHPAPSANTPPNVNVLPSINLSDPRLKKQSILPMPPEIKSFLPTSPLHTSTPIMVFPNQNPMIYRSRKDPRISRIPNNTLSTTPVRRQSINQSHNSSEENWDTDEDEKIPNKTDPRQMINYQRRIDNREGSSCERNHSSNRGVTPVRRNSMSQSRFQLDSPKVAHLAKRISEENSNSALEKEGSITKPNQPKMSIEVQCSSEENWDTDEDEKPPNKTDPRQAKNNQRNIDNRGDPIFERNHSDIRGITPVKSSSISESGFQLNSSTVPNLSKRIPEEDSKSALEKQTSLTKQNRPKISTELPCSSKNSMKQTQHSFAVFAKPPNSESEEDWDAEPDIDNVKSKVLPTEPTPLPINKTTLVSMVSPYHNQISPKSYVSPSHVPHPQMKPGIKPQIPCYGPPQYPNSHHPIQNPVANNRFSCALNDKTERVKYLEAKKHKTAVPRTYKEFKEAKERAQAQENALKRDTSEAEAKKKAEEFKKSNKEVKENAEGKKLKETGKRIEECKKGNKPLQTETVKSNLQSNKHKKPAAGESTLDKMYRTQNFSSKFPKANTSFKIPKKKPEEKVKEEVTKMNSAPVKQTENKGNDKSVNQNRNDKVKTNDNENKAKNTEPPNMKLIEKSTKDKSQYPVPVPAKEKPKASKDSITKQKSESISVSTEIKHPVKELEKDKADNQINADKSISVKEHKEKPREEIIPQKSEESLAKSIENKTIADDNKANTRDPRCRPKPTTKALEEKEAKEEKVQETQEQNLNMFGDILITSSDKQFTLKPQQNLIKFNQLTQELSPKPQRILRRRNTMLVFDSAPLVDKEKLKKANAMLFEDVQEEEKRKRKQAEEDKLIARRHKNLEEMFKSTDDNCTVSTQNIITGKRRTRTTINFNETVNAINVFKHKTMKDTTTSSNLNTTPPVSHPVRPTRTNSKIRTNVLKTNDDDSDDDEENLATKAAKLKGSCKVFNENNNNKSKSVKETKINDEKNTQEAENKSNTKPGRKRAAANKKANEKTKTAAAGNKVNFTPIQAEHQNCAVSSTSADNCTEAEEANYCSTKTSRSLKKENDDNEPSSTANKSNNPTPTPEANVHVFNEIVDQILKPNADREHVLGLLGQILSEDRLQLFKSLMESSNRQNEDQQLSKDENDKQSSVGQKGEVTKLKTFSKDKLQNLKEEYEDEEQEHEERKALKTSKTVCGKKMLMQKKKRSELDRLNEDIRDMFICEGVLTATGRRMCTIMGKGVDTVGNKKSNKEITPIISPLIEQQNTNKRNEEKLKPPTYTRPLRRSVRCCKTTEDNEDDEAQSLISHTTEESLDDTDNSSAMDNTPQRKMPVLKPHTPIKIPEDITPKTFKAKEVANKRKLDSKLKVKAKKSKNESEEDSEIEGKESETDADGEEEEEITENNKNNKIIKNTNLHWHNQSKFSTWCMVCEKRIPANSSAQHYKTHHGENYISRMAPVLLQRFKQGKLNKPVFGVKKAHKQSSWFYRCPFCLKYFNTPMPLWLEHFQNHTVEFRYECSKCHRCSNRRITISRHIKNCDGATVITSAVKLNVPTVINAHVCHLCNFIQLKRVNLERHYIEQHNLDKKTVELLGYIITLFDVENVECVTEDKAVERENEAWKCIEKDEQVIDIDDDEDLPTTINDNTITTQVEETRKYEKEKSKSVKENEDKEVTNKKDLKTTEISQKSEKTQNIKTPGKVVEEIEIIPEETKKSQEVLKLTKQPDKTQEETTSENLAKTDNTNTIAINKEAHIQEKAIIISKLQTKKETRQEELKNKPVTKSTKKVKDKKPNKIVILDLTESEPIFEVIEKKKTVQDLQDELLELAAQAAEKEGNNEQTKEAEITLTTSKKDNENKTLNETLKDVHSQIITPPDSAPVLDRQTTMSDLISNSIDIIYNRVGGSPDNIRPSLNLDFSEANKVCQTASNVFMPSRDENNFSPTIQILAQSIINIGEETTEDERGKNKPITISERISQRFKGLQNTQNTEPAISTPAPINNSKENTFEKLINDTVLELKKVKEQAVNQSNNESLNNTTATDKPRNVFDKLFSDTVLELENDKDEANDSITHSTQSEEIAPEAPKNDLVTVISDDEDWEDIEITETAPTINSTNTGNLQKSKNKGLYQKFGIFKGSNTKSKKNLPPMVFLPKKKTKDKPQQALTLSPTTTAATATKVNNTTTTTNSSISNCTAHLGFKPVINIMDGLLPDSPCNDPIDFVPELAPLEPLQDLNDISSILDSNLSAVNINAADHHTSIEEALDFVSEQQANDKQLESDSLALKTQSRKTAFNNISHVGYSLQTNEENTFKFYCLLEKCTFLYSSDSIGLETHFMLEHSHIKWNGYCEVCQAQCFPELGDGAEYSISKEIRHMMDKHANKTLFDLNTDSTQHSTASSQDSEGRPKIKLRRMTGDCLSRATADNLTKSNEVAPTNSSAPMTMLSALLVAKPKPPTKEMPPQLQMPLTEPLLLDNNKDREPVLAISNANSNFLITSVSSSATETPQLPLQISSVVSLNKPMTPQGTDSAQVQIPKISSVRTLAQKAGNLWTQQLEKEREDLVEAAAESLEVSRILENAGRPSTNREITRSLDDSPVIVAETVPLGQSKTGDFVVTQTVSAQYNEFSSTALGFNISIAPTRSTEDTNSPDTLLPTSTLATTSIASRQYKCMGVGCKFVSRVSVAMSDHLRFHERRNLSNKRDYFACGFCFYCASDVEDYMKHADQFHIINKGGSGSALSSNPSSNVTSQVDTATSLTKKIQNILNSSSGSGATIRYTNPTQLQNQTTQQQVQDTQEVYLKKLRNTIDDIVGPTGLADDKLYRCVIKNCQSQLTEATFLSHIMYHITTTGGNPNNYIFKCPHCVAQYHRSAGIKAHIKNHARNRYFCYLCEETSTNPGQLLKHFSEKHWHTLNMYTKELLKPKLSIDGLDSVLDSSYYVAYTQDLSDEEVRKFGEKLILEWQRKKSGSKTHFKSAEIDLLPLSAIFQREVNCGECEYKTKVRTNMYRHLLMHKQYPGWFKKSGAAKVCCVDPVNPVPCLNSSERFFDKMTNLASSSLIPSSSSTTTSNAKSFKMPYIFIEENKRYTCGCLGCNYHTTTEDVFRIHLSTLHTTTATYRCPFCKEMLCKKGISCHRIVNHLRFHGAIIHRCEECNYQHYMRYVVERHINDKHANLKVNVVSHERISEDNTEGTTTVSEFTGSKYKDVLETTQTNQASIPVTRSSNVESLTFKTYAATSSNSANRKGKWVCEACGHKTGSLLQIQSHCQQQHGVKNQYKCAHCNFGSQQLSQILFHIDEKHAGKTREAICMYRKSINNGEDTMADTRPLWQRNDPTRVRHIRGILMEDEEESEEYRKRFALAEDLDEDQEIDIEETAEGLSCKNYIIGYEFGCYHCSFKTQKFEELKEQHYTNNHNNQIETAKPFWYRLYRRLCCPECRSFIGNYNELQEHLQQSHKKSRFYAGDIRMAENDDTSQRLECGYCSYHCVNTEQLYRHHLKAQHWPQDIRIDNNDQIMEMLALGKSEVSYQCTLCADIFSNRVAIVQHACNTHAGEESFSFRELSNSLIYRCSSCCFTSTQEWDLLRHAIEHYTHFQKCNFCSKPQPSFNVHMQHCYAEHRNDIQKFKTIFPLTDIRKFLLQTLIVFPNGLVLKKRNLLNTKYGKTDIIDEMYEEIYKISQQPPIPRLSIARLVARKSIEAQQKQVDVSNISKQDDILNAMQPRPRSITKRRRTAAFSTGDEDSNEPKEMPKPKFAIVEGSTPTTIAKRRTTVDHDQQQQQQKQNEFNVPLQLAKISKRRRTVAVDRETLFSNNLRSTNTNSLLIDTEINNKKRKTSYAPSPKHQNESYPLNLDMEPFSFYGQTPAPLDLSKIYTKVVIGGIKTPLAIDKFKLLFNIECQLKLVKCDDESQALAYIDYKHIEKACPASHKLKYNEIFKNQ